MNILSAIGEASGGGRIWNSGALDKFVKQFHRLLRLFMMVPFVVLGDRIPVSYEMYVSSSLFYSIVAGIIYVIADSFISRMAAAGEEMAASLVLSTLIHTNGCSSMHH